mmetsp:Transcript_35461/g.78679  ORF Transcript_35461/g.78679 Transcript_35461/m.78679 type:complete len:118 (+) Transcript_35461:134-487(+)|eukprot:CAMPEP_0202902044 /NCGR_PEP_ID=MMETSP1392-20130828/16052_1 /ASSEMBLY_ACC=CAM_ASM_000868 /TAXON_ID=225041 /ORGANISM="Chlamydomonas chlamydogama, Strain SAG 11-48b" /LENGTH=117 /DNA_ID=CAMNT_0049588727 /DNA_START=134 /DNA_END=487 /DNA_ORIENTATION=-
MSATTTTTTTTSQTETTAPSQVPGTEIGDSTRGEASTSTRAGTVAETLTLRLVPRRKKKSVKWSEEVVDNEFLGKKSSKKCCIFHKRRQFGEWSDDEDSDQDCTECEVPAPPPPPSS